MVRTICQQFWTHLLLRDADARHNGWLEGSDGSPASGCGLFLSWVTMRAFTEDGAQDVATSSWAVSPCSTDHAVRSCTAVQKNKKNSNLHQSASTRCNSDCSSELGLHLHWWLVHLLQLAAKLLLLSCCRAGRQP